MELTPLHGAQALPATSPNALAITSVFIGLVALVGIGSFLTWQYVRRRFPG